MLENCSSLAPSFWGGDANTHKNTYSPYSKLVSQQPLSVEQETSGRSGGRGRESDLSELEE